jgi:flagellar M-ring protein FliF
VPVQQGATPADNNERTSQRNEMRREFDTGKAITHTRYEIGRIRTQSVSVLVNEAAAGEGGWTPERLAQLGEMIKTATGHQADRGDQFNITSFSFVAATTTPQMEGMAWWQMPEMKEYLRYLIGAIIGLALVIFGVRPLVNHLISRKNKEQHQGGFATAAGAPHANGPAHNTEKAHDPAVLDATAAGTVLPEHQAQGPQHSIHLPEVGSEFTQQINHLQLLANRESDRVTAVIKYWIERGVSVESVKS